MRQIGPVRAGLLNVLGLGLGYVYVGRIKFAIAFVAWVIGLIAIAGWSGLVFEPMALYALALVAFGAGLFVIVHCVTIALRQRTAVARAYNRWWFYVLWAVASWLISELVVSNRPVLFGYEPFRIPASSMAPTVENGDYVMADTWYFAEADPNYGDLVVFNLPGDVDIKYLKRVVGLPGDTIEIRDDVLIRNGDAVEEPYVRLTGGGPESSRNFGPVVTPDGSYFVLGDNRHRARDSRYIGAIDRKLLHGLVIHRWFAFNESVQWDRFPERLHEDRRDSKSTPSTNQEDTPTNGH